MKQDAPQHGVTGDVTIVIWDGPDVIRRHLSVQEYEQHMLARDLQEGPIMHTIFACLGSALVAGACYSAGAVALCAYLDNSPQVYRAPQSHMGYVGPSRNHVYHDKVWAPSLPYVQVQAPCAEQALIQVPGAIRAEPGGFGPSPWRVFKTKEDYDLYLRQNRLWADGTTR